MLARLSIIPVTGLVAVALGGCGSSSSSGNGEDGKSADQIVADAAGAFGQQQSVHEDIRKTDATGETTASLDATGETTASLDATQTTARVMVNSGDSTQVIIVIGSDVFLGSGGTFTQLAGSDAAQVTYVLPPRQAQCAVKVHGALTKGAVTNIGGKRVIELKDDGKAPGASPNSTFISLDGAPLPVRSVDSGPQTPGGDKSCSDSDTTMSGETDFGYSRPAPQITPPPTAGGSGASSGTTSATSTDTGSSSSSSSTDTGSSASSSSS